MTTYLEGLTEAQLAAVMHGEGPAVVAAGAGSGKTKVICARIARLVAEGVDPARILAVTFSKAGATEMTERVAALGCTAEVRTFHALALRICREDLWGRVTVDDGRYTPCVRQAIDEHEKSSGVRLDPELCSTFIARAKASLLIPCPEDYAASHRLAITVAETLGQTVDPARLLTIYGRAEELRYERRIVTFADMILYAVRYLRDDDSARRRWAALFDYVIQDECQDQDQAQLLFAQLLAQDHRNYMIVGDPAQSIYAFRGADPSFIVNFAETWGAARYALDTNFRSGARIITAANRLCAEMAEGSHLGIVMKPARGLAGDITVRTEDSTSEGEARRIAAEIRGHLQRGGKPDDVACLVRIGAHSGVLEDAFLADGIPYHLAIGVSFYGRKEVAILLSYLRLIVGKYDHDDLGRAVRHPTRYVGQPFVDALGVAAMQQGTWYARMHKAVQLAQPRGQAPRTLMELATLLDSITPETGPETALRKIVEATGYNKWLKRDEGEATADEARVDNVARLIERASKFDTIAELLAYAAEALEQPTGSGKVEDRVVITTIHRSKGLEWPVVYLPSFAEGVLPHHRAPIDEERRLAYVAMTRARDSLRISCPEKMRYGTDQLIPCALSSFVLPDL